MSYIETADWSRVPDRGHGVQFYSDDSQLISLLARYVGTALVTGDVAIVLATKAHRAALDQLVRARGLNLDIPIREGRYIALDAQQALDRMLCGDRIDELKARTVIGALLRRALATPADDGGIPRVAAFGELVALLINSSRPDEALRLEEIWNVLASQYPFRLCCAYPMNGFTQRHAASFVRICAQHSHVFHAAESHHRAEAADRAT